MASAAGGMEIEEVAAKSPELILKEALEPGYGLAPFQGAQHGVRDGRGIGKRQRARWRR